MKNNDLLKNTKTPSGRNKARIEVLYEVVFAWLGNIVRTKAFKISLIFVIIVGAVVGINFAYWKLSDFPAEIVGVWYEYEEDLTVEEYESKNFEIKKLGIAANNTIQYLERPSLGNKSVDLLVGSDRHQGSDFGKLLLPWGTYTFQFPSFAIHKLSDYKVENDILYITIDGEKKIFYKDKVKITNQYVKKFYDIDDVHQYYYDYLVSRGANEISYTDFFEIINNDDAAVIMFSEYVDYKNITADKAEWDDIFREQKLNWYFITGKNVSDEEYQMILGSEIGKYLGMQFTFVWVDTLAEPIVIVADGGSNPDFYRIRSQFDQIKKLINN